MKTRISVNIIEPRTHTIQAYKIILTEAEKWREYSKGERDAD